MSRWRAALYFDVTIDVCGIFFRFPSFSCCDSKRAERKVDGGAKEITPNTTDYVTVEITYNLQPENHNNGFRLLSFTAPIFCVLGAVLCVRVRKRENVDYGRVCVDD